MAATKTADECAALWARWTPWIVAGVTAWAVPVAAWQAALAAVALALDWTTLSTLLTGSEPMLFGRRIPYVSFLGALLVAELPFWVLPAVKAALLAAGVALGIMEAWWLTHVVGATAASTAVHWVCALMAAHEAKRVADRGVALFCDKGPLLSDAALAPLRSPLRAILTRCLHPYPAHSSFGLECFSDIQYATPEEAAAAGDQAHLLRLDVYRKPPASGPAGAGLRPVAVYIHGGGWTRGLGDKANRTPFVFHAAEDGWISVTINYRLFPCNLWPDYIIDCKRAIRWVKRNIARYGGDPELVVVSGGSAGGHLASLIALTGGPEYNVPEWQPGFEEEDTSVQGCVAFYPACDTSGEWWRNYTGQPFDAAAHERASPMHHAMRVARLVREGRSAHELCPFLNLQGESDGLVPAVYVRAFHRELSRHPRRGLCEYLEFPNAVHGFDLISSPRSLYANAVAMRFCEAVRAAHGLRRKLEASRRRDSES